MASVFLDAHVIIFIDYLEQGTTVTGKYYAAFFDKLNDEIKNTSLKAMANFGKKKRLFSLKIQILFSPYGISILKTNRKILTDNKLNRHDNQHEIKSLSILYNICLSNSHKHKRVESTRSQFLYKQGLKLRCLRNCRDAINGIIVLTALDIQISNIYNVLNI